MPDTNTKTNDQALIREYADSNSEPAFAELVHQHIHLVYSVAFRYVGNAADAQDVTQAVFVILARKAGGLRHRTTLTGWLYETTRLTAAALLRTGARQRVRDHEAYMQSISDDSQTSEAWRQLAPVLEEAMGRLNEKERTVLALRLFDNKTAAQTGALLGMGTDAAHKRTTRALEKLRRFFLQRGISSSTALISGAISANAILAAPAPLAKSVVAAAMVKGAAANGSTLILIKGALKIMAWSKAKTSITTAAILLLLAGTGTVMVKHTLMQTHTDTPRLQPRLAQIGQAIRISPDGNVSVIRIPTNLPSAGGSYGHNSGNAFAFKLKTGHDAILRQLNQEHALILSDTPDLVRAQFPKTPNNEMDFKFADGKLARLTFVYKGHRSNDISIGPDR